MENELNDVLVVLEAIGLQYFSLKSLTEKNSKTRPSVWRVVYMIFLLILISGLVIIYVARDHTRIKQDEITIKNVIMFMIQHSMDIGLSLVICVGLIHSLVSTQCVKKVYLNSNEVSRLINDEFKMAFNYKSVRKEAWRKLVFVLMFVLTLHVIVILVHAGTPDNVYQLLLGILPMLFLSMVVYKFIFYVCMINHQLAFLKVILDDVFKVKTIKPIETINLHLTIIKPVNTKVDELKKLRIISKVYNIIYENGSLINASHGFTMLILLLSVVLAITVSGYELFVIALGGFPREQLAGN